MTPNDAFTVVAMWMLSRQCVCQDWENYPDIGIHDWEQISGVLGVLMDRLAPTSGEYREAYALLKSRADAHAV